MGSGGRNRANIDWKTVDGYLRSQCDGATIARMLGIHPETLYKRVEEEFGIGFTEYSQQKKSEGKEALRAKQMQEAMAGNTSMLIWLGKQYLDQKDKHESKVDLNTTPVIELPQKTEPDAV